jgi:HEAT repeat protein
MNRILLCTCLLALSSARITGQPPPAIDGRSLESWTKELGKDDPLAREEALDALARLGPNAKPSLDAIRPLLKDALPTVRARAAVALWKIEGKTDAALPVLVETARRPSRTIRQLLLDAVGGPGPDAKALAPALVECFNDRDPNLKSRCMQLFREMGQGGLDGLRIGLERDDPVIRESCLKAIGQLGPQAAEAVPAVRLRLKDQEPALRVLAARTLWQVNQDTTTLPVLLAIVAGKDARARADAIGVIFLFKPMPREAIPALEAALNESDPRTRVSAAAALFHMDGRTKDTLPVLLAGFKDSSGFGPRLVARDALAQMRDAAREIVPALVQYIPSAPQTPTMQQDLVNILGHMGDEAVEPLTKLLDDERQFCRAVAINALAGTGEKGCSALAAALPKAEMSDKKLICTAISRYSGRSNAVPLALAGLLKEEDNLGLANDAMYALFNLGRRAAPATPAIVDIVRDSTLSERVRERAFRFFLAVGPSGKDAVPRLVEMLKAEKPPEGVLLSTLVALGAIGPAAREAIPGIKACVKDATPRIRAAALAALCDIDPVDEAILPGLIAMLEEAKKSPLPSVVTQVLSYRRSNAAGAVPALVELLKQPTPAQGKLGIVNALGEIGPVARDAVRVMKQQLHEKDPNYRYRAAVALARIGVHDQEILDELVSELRTTSSLFREEAVESLTTLGAKAAGAAPGLVEEWRKKVQVDERLRLADALSAVDPAAAKEVADWARLQISEPHRGTRAALVLWRIDPKSTEPIAYLGKLLREGKPAEQLLAAQALSKTGPAAKELAPALEAALLVRPDRTVPEELRRNAQVENVLLHLFAARAILRVEPKSSEKAIAALVALLRTEEPLHAHYHKAVVDTLESLGRDASAALPTLIEVYPTEPTYVRHAIHAAVQSIDPRSVPKLGR